MNTLQMIARNSVKFEPISAEISPVLPSIPKLSLCRKKTLVNGNGHDRCEYCGNASHKKRGACKRFSCRVCNEMFASRILCRSHSSRCKRRLKHRCLFPICHRVFGNSDDVVQHLLGCHITVDIVRVFPGGDNYEAWKQAHMNGYVLLKGRLPRRSRFQYYACKYLMEGDPTMCDGQVLVFHSPSGDIAIEMSKHQCAMKLLNGNNRTDVKWEMRNGSHQNGSTSSVLDLKPMSMWSRRSGNCIKHSIFNYAAKLNEYLDNNTLSRSVLVEIEQLLKQALLRISTSKNGNDIVTVDVEKDEPRSFTKELSDATNIMETVCRVGRYAVSRLHLKSLDYRITIGETTLIKSVASDFRRGWLYDTVIDAFMYLLCGPRADAMFLETSVVQVIDGCDSPSIQSLRTQCADKSIDDIAAIFVPFNSEGGHWVLLAVLPKQRSIGIYDPISQEALNDDVTRFVKQLICVLLNDFGQTETWDITYPKHAIQKGGYNCGVYVCWFAERIINGEDCCQTFDEDEFRKRIYDSIVNNSSKYS